MILPRIFFTFLLGFLFCKVLARIETERSFDPNMQIPDDIEELTNNATTRLSDILQLIQSNLFNSTVPLSVSRNPRDEFDSLFQSDTSSTRLRMDDAMKITLASLMADTIKDVVQLCIYASNSNEEAYFSRIDDNLSDMILALSDIDKFSGMVRQSLGAQPDTFYQEIEDYLPKTSTLLSIPVI
ncbi:unnamed protein product [Rhizoctonia solani]|uniref:Uncharacterized protein n=1 Tax=Rhizoctonia solani TaxID=456999 RepID=A0A8H3HZ91_9AGAM|nr:unnamed protein product [Rhizoctonia solani]